MPIDFRLYPKKKLIISTWTGEITDDMMIQEYQRALDKGTWKPDYNHLANMLNAEATEITGDGLIRLFKFNQELYGYDSLMTMKIAVVTNKELIESLTKIYNALLKGSTRSGRFFHNVRDALNWIKE